ncbi:hypothetical protein SAMN04487950_1444 [Halogranum rubrum]|uniref:Uncharacterized protein n=1 Tax=Halogranum rubrum TaxID=553466 RepID=A0A1I4CVS6_9EURY|nr:hypothetical protein [Halogranum rubrum]SFK85398.1 hypothetical protein SAMN04487950_1444 [Halogranum rubrum]
MSSPLRSGLHVALNHPRVLALVAAVVLVEVALRAVLGFIHPVASVVCPPVVSIPVLGAALPTIRGLVAGPSSTPDWNFRERLIEYGPRLATAAVACHIVALTLGAALFLVVDTPLRFAFYVVDGGTLPWELVYVTPLPSVLIGAFLAWGPLATVVTRVVDDDPLPTAFETSVGVAVGTPRRTGTVLLLHLVAVFVVVGSALTAAAFVRQSYAELTTVVVVLSGLVLTAGILSLGFLVPVHAALANVTPDRATVSIRHVALAIFVVSAAVAGASAIRVSEVRPAPDLEPLPNDPSEMYTTALSNTGQTSYDVQFTEIQNDHVLRFWWTVDRSDRQVLANSSIQRNPAYGDTGLAYHAFDNNPEFGLGDRQVDGSTATVLPAYWFFQSEVRPAGGYALPLPSTGEWQVVDETDDTVTLELTDDDAVYRALYDSRPEDRNVTYETAWIRMDIDTERGVVTGESARLSGTRDGSSLEVRRRYTVETGDDVDVKRPEKLNPRQPTEWVWKLFAY